MVGVVSDNTRPSLGWDGTLTLTAVDPRDPARIFATDGTDLERSIDGGCTWHRVFTTGLNGQDGPAGYRISRVVIGGSGPSSHVYLLLQVTPASLEAGNNRNQIAASTDAGASFTVGGDLFLPPAPVGSSAAASSCSWEISDDTSIDLVPVPGNARMLYLLCNANPQPVLFVTTDSAHTWTRVTTIGLPYWAGYVPVTVAQTSSRSLWVAAVSGATTSAPGVWRSSDGGRTFDEVFAFPPATPGQESSQVSVQTFLPSGAKPTSLQVLAVNEAAIALSTNAGRKWSLIPPPAHGTQAGPVISAAFGPRAGEITAFTAYGASYYYRGVGPSAQASCGEATLAWSYSIAKKRWTSLGAPAITPAPGGSAVFGMTPSGAGNSSALYGIEPGLSSPCTGGAGTLSPHIIAYTGP
jgi:hypothetical protein